MRTDEERAQGLMNRRYMPAERGMLFDFKEVQPAMMWMKNTYIPLDMVFIRKDGTIARIAENTEPHSTRTISSGEPVLGVLELNAGISEKEGIKPATRSNIRFLEPQASPEACRGAGSMLRDAGGREPFRSPTGGV